MVASRRWRRLLFSFNLMGYFFLISSTPTLLSVRTYLSRHRRLPERHFRWAARSAALALRRRLQRHRSFAIAVMFVLAVPVVASIGYAGLTSGAALLAATFLGGFLVLGIQAGLNVAGALIYPTSLRASGSGWELGLGRFGSIIGPLLGALFVGLSVEKLYLWSALPFAAGAIVSFAVHVLNTARLRANPELAKAQ